MDPPWQYFGEKPPKRHSLTHVIQNLFIKAVWLKQCAPMPSTIMQKLGKYSRAVLEKKSKPLKIEYLIPHNQELLFLLEKPSSSGDASYCPLQSPF